jgi:hypothetical protein
MWSRVDIVLTDVSKELIASIVRVEEKREEPIPFTDTSFLSSLPLSSNGRK